MIVFEAIDAGHGDALLVRYMGDNGFERIILVDAGPKSAKTSTGNSYVPVNTRVVPRLMQVKDERDGNANDIRAGNDTLTLDLVVCTHIDDDHIAGIERLYGCLSGDVACAPGGNLIEAKSLWFNSFSTLMGDAVDIAAADLSAAPQAVVVSVGQGENVTKFANATGVSINRNAPGALVAAGQKPNGFGPATVTILNPDAKALEKLRKQWLAEVKKKKKDGVTSAAGAPGLAWFTADQAVPNLSSITMLIEGFGRRILLTGDQRGDHVLEALDDLGLRKPGETFHVDIMKVPHHGSTANVQPEFIAAVTADIYVFSANGKDQNPDPPVLELVASEAKKGRSFTMAFTNCEMVYERNKAGKFGTIDGAEVTTLQQAIAALKKRPEVLANVTFACRDPDAHSIAFALAAKP